MSPSDRYFIFTAAIQTVRITTWFLFVLLFAMSCLDTPDCFLLNNDRAGISFRVFGSTRADSVRFQALTVNGNVIHEGDTTVAFWPVLLDRFEKAATVAITNAGETKVMDLGYNVKVQFVSEECGARYILSDLTLKDHAFDSVAVINPTPGRDGSTQSIEVYRCPRGNVMGVSFWQLKMPRTGATSSETVAAPLSSLSANGNIVLENISRSFLKIPVDAAGTEVDLAFNFKNGFGFSTANRSLGLTYNMSTRNFGQTCGQVEIVSNLSIKAGHTLDSVSFANDNAGKPRTALTDPVQTNINIYRCPPTNQVQIAFVNPGTTTGKSVEVKKITAGYTSDVFYEGQRKSTVMLPLNPEATETTFTIEYATGSQTISFVYSWSNPRPTLFKPGFACSARQVITNLAEGADNASATITNPLVLYPAVTNMNLEIP